MDSGMADPRDLANADAQFAIRTVVDFIRHDSPNSPPEKDSLEG
jgi:hypothetical protein